jgi:transcription antitermination factor NusG
MKGGIAGPKEAAVVRLRPGKHASEAADIQIVIEERRILLVTVDAVGG